MKKRNYIILPGLVWLFSGFMLLYKGLHFIADAILQTHSLCFRMQHLFGTAQQAATVFIGLGLLVGYVKGRFVLVKSVRRIVKRIDLLPYPIRFSQAYHPSYWLLIASMIALGVSLRFLPIALDIRGFIDVAIGSALINGSMLFFRAARSFNVAKTYL